MNWKQIAENLAEIVGGDWLPSRIRERIDSFENVFIACSGGADSVFLALWFGWLSRTGKLSSPVTILHFNHNLRGEDSNGDQCFTSKLGNALGIACLTDEWDRSEVSKSVSEEAARDARMKFFAKVVGSAKGSSVILTGHHADDIAETMLMRLSRGSGLQGLTAPREVSIGSNGLNFVRPLLGLGKGEILSYLEKAGATWREDETNQEGLYYRNRLRQSVIPEWENAADRPIRGGVAQARALLEEDWQALEELFDASWNDTRRDPNALDWEQMVTMPRSFQRRALNRLLVEGGAMPLALAATEEVLDYLRAKKAFKVSVEKDLWLAGSAALRRVEFIWAKRIFDWRPVRLPLNVSLCLPGSGSIHAREVALDAELNERVQSGAFSHDQTAFLAIDGKQNGELWVRSWRAGDAYRPMGRKSFVKLKELFIDRKVPREERGLLPIVVDSEDNILWIPGLPPSYGSRIQTRTTRALQLTYGK
ncbi:MAG: tRNA lysidine(34) synthetase TilS [Opitutales bacterium]|nr:tRNA lysidine(34) synthetase TilS [Opitutales bacterium]MBT5815155.1 tRNA lysidine(34) synthetase TilS [Opitutales bacterium]MBT6769985.1 tRNA lysidine(34) synthetase TilS [Opitutales bacterium]